ncbi:MAG TPA: VWA domain-containing protein [Terriglobia bacterium]|nr:VWA domain-containing protein [Terriglobia bacterium]
MRRHFACIFLIAFSGALLKAGQTFEGGRIQRTVELVQLDVAVTNKKGDYVTGLRPWNFEIYEDGIPEKLATFGEENEAPRSVAAFGRPGRSQPGIRPSSIEPSHAGHGMGRSVFILFDTSNYMYKSFVYAQDAIGEFIRSLDGSDRVAFYSYSRDLSRDSLLTDNRSQVLRGVRATVAGDDAALYNGLLLTLEDAAQFSGRRVVVVFSNGPDNSSMIAPEHVLDLAQAEGVPIYMVCTRKARLDPISTAVFDRVSAATGGTAYFSKNWEDEQKAFRSIRNDLAHLYSLSYYPQANANRGWRKITVKLVGVEHAKKFHLRTRTGYRPEAVRTAGISLTPSR